jgi:hypothetical protein
MVEVDGASKRLSALLGEVAPARKTEEAERPLARWAAPPVPFAS